MPNNVRNKMTLIGNEDTICKIKKIIGSVNPPIDFNRIIPQPKHILQVDIGSGLKKAYGEDATWYNWRVTNWGTKWGAYGFEPDQGWEQNELSFETAWAPPVPIFRELSCWGVSVVVRVEGEIDPGALVFENGWYGAAEMPLKPRSESEGEEGGGEEMFTEEQWEEIISKAWEDLRKRSEPYVGEIAEKLKKMMEEET